MHKAAGWMLREAGKRDAAALGLSGAAGRTNAAHHAALCHRAPAPGAPPRLAGGSAADVTSGPARSGPTRSGICIFLYRRRCRL